MKKISLMTMFMVCTTLGYTSASAACEGNYVGKPPVLTGLYQLPDGCLSDKSGSSDDDDDDDDDDNRKPASSLSF